jgi:hypothetical protein
MVIVRMGLGSSDVFDFNEFLREIVSSIKEDVN